jgi:muramoyltetrapeptide carboxypeptidase
MGGATRFGRPLPEGGCIGCVAPAGPYFNRSEVLRGVRWWEDQGYRVKLAEGVWDRDDYVAGSPEVRARDLMTMFADPEVDAIQVLHGGYGSTETIPHLDFDLIAEHPKAFVGFSDITSLHLAIGLRSGLATIHANGLHGMGSSDITGFTKERLLAVLRGGGAGPVPANPDDPYVRALSGGRVTAPLAGGNLWLIMRTLATPWEADFEGCILFFEAVDHPPWELDAMLTHLAQAGKLEAVAGVMVGELEGCDWREDRPEVPRTRSLEDVLEARLGRLGVPVLYGLPLGHGKHLAAIPLGVSATLEADEGTLTIEEPALRP